MQNRFLLLPGPAWGVEGRMHSPIPVRGDPRNSQLYDCLHFQEDWKCVKGKGIKTALVSLRVKTSSAPILYLFIFADSTVGTDEILAGEKKKSSNSLEIS